MAVKAAADFGVMLHDGLADGIWIEAPQFTPEEIRDVELMILAGLASPLLTHRIYRLPGLRPYAL